MTDKQQSRTKELGLKIAKEFLDSGSIKASAGEIDSALDRGELIEIESVAAVVHATAHLFWTSFDNGQRFSEHLEERAIAARERFDQGE